MAARIEGSASPVANARVGDPRPWMTLANATCLQFMHILDGAAANGAVRSIKSGLRATRATQTTLGTILEPDLTTVLHALHLGSRVAAGFSRRCILLTGAIAFAIGSLTSAANQDSSQYMHAKGVLAMSIASSVLAGRLGVALIRAGSTKRQAPSASARGLNNSAVRAFRMVAGA